MCVRGGCEEGGLVGGGGGVHGWVVGVGEVVLT